MGKLCNYTFILTPLISGFRKQNCFYLWRISPLVEITIKCCLINSQLRVQCTHCSPCLCGVQRMSRRTMVNQQNHSPYFCSALRVRMNRLLLQSPAMTNGVPIINFTFTHPTEPYSTAFQLLQQLLNLSWLILLNTYLASLAVVPKLILDSEYCKFYTAYDQNVIVIVTIIVRSNLSIII